MSFYLFIILSVITIFSALAVVFSKNPMYSALWLIVCFFTVAGHYVLLNAQFLAIVHLIVYAGAIMVLFLFVVMLLNLNAQSEPHHNAKLKFAVTLTGGLLFVVLIASLRATELSEFYLPAKNNLGYVEKVGKKLFTDYLVPFEISSVLFLSAMIGAVVLAKKEKN